jgi:peptidase M48-like protein
MDAPPARLLNLIRWSCAVAAIASATLPVRAASGSRDEVATVQTLIDDLRARLSIAVPVTASMVPHNPLLVSVEAAPGGGDAFQLAFEDGFLNTLDDDELRAVVAHELGHVWIFTHHPYLQTEELANQVALRLVSRDSMNKVYEKVWQRTGVKGDLAYLPSK